MGMQNHVVAQAAIAADNCAAMEPASRADNAAFTHRGERMDGGIGSQLSGRVDGGARVDSGRRLRRLSVQMTDNGDKGRQRVRHLDQRERLTIRAAQFIAPLGHGCGDDGRAGPAGLEVTDVAIVLDKCNVVRPGLVHRLGGENDSLLAVDVPLDQFR